MIKSKKFNPADIQKRMLKQAQDNISKEGMDINCPGCKEEIKVRAGKNTCPKCGCEVNFDVTTDQ